VPAINLTLNYAVSVTAPSLATACSSACRHSRSKSIGLHSCKKSKVIHCWLECLVGTETLIVRTPSYPQIHMSVSSEADLLARTLYSSNICLERLGTRPGYRSHTQTSWDEQRARWDREGLEWSVGICPAELGFSGGDPVVAVAGDVTLDGRSASARAFTSQAPSSAFW
jgi:hypothetical protein